MGSYARGYDQLTPLIRRDVCLCLFRLVCDFSIEMLFLLVEHQKLLTQPYNGLPRCIGVVTFAD